MDEIERVELGSERAYVTDTEAVHEEGHWLRSKRTVIPIDQVTSVTIDERGSWTLVILGILSGWYCAGGILRIGFADNPETWVIVTTIALGVLAAIFLTAFFLIKWVHVTVTAADASFSIKDGGRHGTQLRDFGRATSFLAAGSKKAGSSGTRAPATR